MKTNRIWNVAVGTVQKSDRGHLLHLIGQECSAGLHGRLPVPSQILGHRRLRHLGSHLEQFPVNAGCSPQRVGVAHPPNQVANLGSCVRSSRRAPRLPCPIQGEALRCQAMTVAGWTSCRHRRQPDQNRDNRTHNTRSERLRRKRRGAFRSENSQLVTKDENFGLQGGTGSKTRGDRGTKAEENGGHDGDDYNLTDDGKLCVFRFDGVFGTHTHVWASSLKNAKFIEFSRSVNHANPVT